MDRNFGGVVWTNHALERLRQRGITQGDAWAAFRRPDQSHFASTKQAWVFYKTYPSTASDQAERIEVVASQNEKKQWVILSVWSKKVYGQKKSESLVKLIVKRLKERRRINS